MELFIIALAAWLIYKLLKKQSQSETTTTDVGVSEEVEEPLDRSDWVDDFEVTGYPIPVQATVKLHYTNAKGEVSERVVDIRECDSVGKTGVLIGFCQMRRSIRTFRFDRIQRAIDVETGEVINDLQAWLKQAYESSPACALRKLFYDSYDVIRTLLYLSKADGRFTKPEKEVMLDYCRQQTGNVVIDLKAMEKALHDIDTPSKQAFKLACNNIAKGSSATRKSIYELVTSLVAADGRLDPDELSALEYLRKKLSVETEVKLIPA